MNKCTKIMPVFYNFQINREKNFDFTFFLTSHAYCLLLSLSIGKECRTTNTPFVEHLEHTSHHHDLLQSRGEEP
jgi:hypothetical protein